MSEAAAILARLVPYVDKANVRAFWRHQGAGDQLESVLTDARRVVLAETGQRLPCRRVKQVVTNKPA